jgi:hypothetical protein
LFKGMRTMTNLPKSQSLFRRVATRMKLATFGVRAYVAFLAVTVLYGIGLLASRLLGAMPGWFGSIPLFSFSLFGSVLKGGVTQPPWGWRERNLVPRVAPLRVPTLGLVA